MLKVLTIKNNEKFLRQRSSVVDFQDKDLPQDLKDIKEYCTVNSGFYAMASIQFGIPKRIIYIKSTKQNGSNDCAGSEHNLEHILMINPEIVSQKGKTEFWEACVSGLDNFALVERPYEIVVRYQNENGDIKVQKFEGFSSTVISHEIDHLDGIFHMDRAKKLLQLPASERVEYRRQHPYKIISKDCEFTYDTNINSNIYWKYLQTSAYFCAIRIVISLKDKQKN